MFTGKESRSWSVFFAFESADETSQREFMRSIIVKQLNYKHWPISLPSHLFVHVQDYKWGEEERAVSGFTSDDFIRS